MDPWNPWIYGFHGILGSMGSMMAHMAPWNSWITWDPWSTKNHEYKPWIHEIHGGPNPNQPFEPTAGQPNRAEPKRQST